MKKFHFEHWHKIALYLVIFDAFMVNICYLVALLLRFDLKYSTIPEVYIEAWSNFAPIYTFFCIMVFNFKRMYNSIWRYVGYKETYTIITANLITMAFQIIGITAFFTRMPISYYLVGALLQVLVTFSIRFAYRFYLMLTGRRKKTTDETRNVMLIGAGSAGQMILKDLHKAKELDHKVCCIIDDNPNKWHRSVEGVPVVGGRDTILANVEKFNIDEIYIAIPSASSKDKRAILEICKDTDCELMNLPGVYQLVNGEVTISNPKKVDIEDLLGRDTINLDLDVISSFLKGKTVLVTGGGGSIGSELCRQIAARDPKKLVVFDIYENNAHAIMLELKDKYPELDLEVIIGSVRDSGKVNAVFEKYRPQVVYHAAAHKHVPLMEYSPCESIKNNAIGTYKTAYAAMCYGCERFVLISTDKAVNPTNIMGASKRLCEMIVQSFDQKIKEGKAAELPYLQRHEDNPAFVPTVPQNPKTEFVAVRFGNVLGSNGSVIPRFREQIAKGGPVTVTHKDIIRYFMTIPEAVSLVLTAGTYAHGGEIFVLDMGDPVKIDDLARNMIRLSGYKPDVDIKVEYTGLRPGEKLYEEKLMSEEGLTKTDNELIHIAKPIDFDTDEFLTQMRSLTQAAYAEKDNIADLVMDVVPTFHRESAN